MADLTVAESDALATDIRALALRVLEQADGYVARRVDPAEFEDDLNELVLALTDAATVAADMADYNAP